MIRLAARLRTAGVASITAAAFLHYTRPSFAEAVSRCVAQGADDVMIVPYFLGPSLFVREDLPKLVELSRANYPGVTLRLTQPLGDHPALARLVMQRALEADYLAAFPMLPQLGPQRILVRNDHWNPIYTSHPTALLMMAHGGPDPHAHQPIYVVAERIRAYQRYAAVDVCFMDVSRPNVIESLDSLAQKGIIHVIVVPHFLQMGAHVAGDLPMMVGAARARYPSMTVLLAGYLGYDRLLLSVIIDRIMALRSPLNRSTPLFTAGVRDQGPGMRSG
jgi:sirohydrochlorin cobaltochelatase